MVRTSYCAAVRQPCIAHHTRKRRRHAKNDAPLPQAACWAACAAYEEEAADNALEYACRAVNGSIRHEVTRLYLYVAYKPGRDTSGYGKAPLRIAKPRRKHRCRKTASQTAPAPGPGNNASTRPSTQARMQLSTESDAPRLAEQTIEGLPATIPYPPCTGQRPRGRALCKRACNNNKRNCRKVMTPYWQSRYIMSIVRRRLSPPSRRCKAFPQRTTFLTTVFPSLPLERIR